MIENINDFLSFICLIAMTLACAYFVFTTFNLHRRLKIDRMESLYYREEEDYYDDNEESNDYF